MSLNVNPSGGGTVSADGVSTSSSETIYETDGSSVTPFINKNEQSYNRDRKMLCHIMYRSH